MDNDEKIIAGFLTGVFILGFLLIGYYITDGAPFDKHYRMCRHLIEKKEDIRLVDEKCLK